MPDAWRLLEQRMDAVTTTLENRLGAILRADLVLRRCSGSFVGAGPQKMVLVALLVYEGTPVTLQELADMAGYHKSTTGRAVEALIRQGLVRCEGQMPATQGRPGWCEYRVVMEEG